MKAVVVFALIAVLVACALASNTDALWEKLEAIQTLSQQLEEEKSSVLIQLQAAQETQLASPEELSASEELATSESSYDCGVAYDNGKALGSRQCVNVDGKAMTTVLFEKFQALRSAAAAAGVSLKVNSAFRTQAEQQRLYNCYLTKKCNNGNLAAKPGYSNHQNGIAVDIAGTATASIYTWLRNNASKYGFVRTVASETWHWEYRAGARCNAFVGYTCK